MVCMHRDPAWLSTPHDEMFANGQQNAGTRCEDRGALGTRKSGIGGVAVTCRYEFIASTPSATNLDATLAAQKVRRLQGGRESSFQYGYDMERVNALCFLMAFPDHQPRSSSTKVQNLSNTIA